MFDLEVIKRYREKVNDEAYIKILETAVRANHSILTEKARGIAGVAMKASISAQALATIKAIVNCEHVQTKK